MTNTIAIKNNAILRVKSEKKKSGLFGKIENSASLILIATMFIAGTLLSLCFGIPIKRVMGNYSYDVLVILIALSCYGFSIATNCHIIWCIWLNWCVCIDKI